jgi:DNA-binding MarR family transcriptional regulator
MALVNHPTALPTDLPAAVHSASERLGMLWVDSYGGAGHRVSPSQLRALTAIQQHRGTNLTDLATELGAILSSASRLCDRLVAAGLVDRTQSSGDRREVAMRLTREGVRLMAAIAREREAAVSRVLEGMTAEEQAGLLRGLEAFSASRRVPEARARRTS